MFVKVCGLREPAHVAAAVEAGVDAVGFMLTTSPRQVTPARARELAAEVPAGVLTVAVFRGETVDEVRTAALTSGVRAIQLHGEEPPEHFAALRELGLPMIRATGRSGDAGLRCGAFGEDLLIVDAPEPGGGTTWNWDSLDSTTIGGQWLLAGGLRPDNVAAAIATTRPWGVDVSSGVEVSRGVKDPDLIRAFIAAARS